MRHSLNIPCTVLLSYILLLVSCSKKGADATVSTTSNTPNPTATLISGNYTISSYTQKAEDKTSLFNGIVFTFSKSGSVTADNKGTTTTGTWTYKASSVGYYGSTPSKAAFTMNMGTADPFNHLNKTWNIDTGGTDASHLSLTNPEPVDDEHIKFAKQ